MRAAVFHGSHDVRVENVADPISPAPGEVVLKVLRAAICGTDAAEWDHGPVLCRPGVVLGHEFVGRVVELGNDVTGLRVGDRVVSGAGISCGRCPWCLRSRTNLCAEYRTLGLQVDGGLAEYVTSPAAICYLVPDVCDDDAAAMTQPLAVALHALSRVALGRDESVAVIGVGGVGSFIVAGASRRAVDGRVVAIDIDAEKLTTASELGADEAVEQEPDVEQCHAGRGRAPDSRRRGRVGAFARLLIGNRIRRLIFERQCVHAAHTTHEEAQPDGAGQGQDGDIEQLEEGVALGGD